MCFAPQRRALYLHLKCQKWSTPLVFCTFWLGNVLLATTACTFSTSQLPKVVRTPSVLYILTWKCASRHNGVHFFNISTSKSGPSTRCFVHFWLGHVLLATTACNFSSLIWPAGSAPAALASLLFDPPEPQIIGKTQCFATFPTFSRTWIFFLLTLLSSSLLSSNLSLLSASALLCFSSVHIVGSLTSKLPSAMFIDWDIIGMFNVRLVSWAMDTPPMRLIFPPTDTVFQLQSQFQKPTCNLMGKMMTNQWI